MKSYNGVKTTTSTDLSMTNVEQEMQYEII
jgi:hypothetical protein